MITTTSQYMPQFNMLILHISLSSLYPK